MILLNPRYPKEFQENVTKQLSSLLPGHFWLLTSGTTGKPKAVALSQEALLTSAKAINQHLQSDHTDVWINPLPTFHVGGLGILTRAHLSGAKILTLEKWSAESFFTLAQKATLSALVPTQVYDLIQLGKKAPSSMRAIVVGGGALSDHIYTQAAHLGWALLPSYGLTECSSQVATATRNSKELHLLNHVEVKIIEGKIAIKSPALLTAYASLEDNTLHDPKQSGWLITEDFGALKNNVLTIRGREGDFLKIGGESVHLGELQQVLEKIKLELNVSTPLILVAAKDPRLGSRIDLVIEGETTPLIGQIIDCYQAHVLPFERIHNLSNIEKIPRSPLGKPLKASFT